jgi:CRP-like cAMP-binding protein
MHASTTSLGRNRILAALPTDDYQRLQPYLTPVKLSHGMVLYEIGERVQHVYFPVNALISFVIPMEDGSTVEVGLIGNDGMSGTAALVGEDTATCRALVQIPDLAIRAPLAVIKEEFGRRGEFQNLLLRFMLSHLKQVEQRAACNASHTVEERLARWLLMCSERVQSDELKLTPEVLSRIFAARWTTVSAAATVFLAEGLIEYYNGSIRIVDRRRLEGFSCDCYRAIEEESNQLHYQY